ncbi:MAG: hypothetical protein QNK30_13895 [Bacteroidales bacterium]|nr:hypothetical protein [Bacteroidales bacterium]
MVEKLEKYRRYIFAGIVIIALGVTFSTTLKDSLGSLGTVFIAIGGLFFIIGMNMKKKEEESKNN